MQNSRYKIHGNITGFLQHSIAVGGSTETYYSETSFAIAVATMSSLAIAIKVSATLYLSFNWLPKMRISKKLAYHALQYSHYA